MLKNLGLKASLVHLLNKGVLFHSESILCLCKIIEKSEQCFNAFWLHKVFVTLKKMLAEWLLSYEDVAGVHILRYNVVPSVL